MMRTNALAIALAAVLTATAGYAASVDDVEAPRGQRVEAPRDRTDDVEAPRGQSVQNRTDEVQGLCSKEAQ